MAYWWVNHNQTAKHALTTGTLWSPKNEANGARSEFYDNMKRVQGGDYIVSMSNSTLTHIGLVRDPAVSAPKPPTYKTTERWSGYGWLMLVGWRRLRQPVHPADLLDELRQYLPSKYSPINSRTGKGNQKAYLAGISRDAFRLLMRAAGEVELLDADRLWEDPDFFHAGVEEATQPFVGPEFDLTALQVELLDRVDRLLDDVALMRSRGRIGHNQPPEKIESEFQFSDPDLDVIEHAALAVKNVAVSPARDSQKLLDARNALYAKLLQAGEILARKSGIATDEFSKAYGGFMGRAAGPITLVGLDLTYAKLSGFPSILSAIYAVVQHSTAWLQAIAAV